MNSLPTALESDDLSCTTPAGGLVLTPAGGLAPLPQWAPYLDLSGSQVAGWPLCLCENEPGRGDYPGYCFRRLRDRRVFRGNRASAGAHPADAPIRVHVRPAILEAD